MIIPSLNPLWKIDSCQISSLVKYCQNKQTNNPLKPRLYALHIQYTLNIGMNSLGTKYYFAVNFHCSEHFYLVLEIMDVFVCM